MKMVLENANGKIIKGIRQEGGADARYDDVVIEFEDGSSMLIQGDFWIKELASGQKDKVEAEVASYHPEKGGSGMPKPVIAHVTHYR